MRSARMTRSDPKRDPSWSPVKPIVRENADTPTTTRSNKFQPSCKKLKPKATMRNNNSAEKMEVKKMSELRNRSLVLCSDEFHSASMQLRTKFRLISKPMNALNKLLSNIDCSNLQQRRNSEILRCSRRFAARTLFAMASTHSSLFSVPSAAHKLYTRPRLTLERRDSSQDIT